MNKMKKDAIDRIISESVLETGSSNVLPKLSNNLDIIRSAAEESGIDINDPLITAISCIMTAQVNAVDVMRSVLCKIFCEDNEEPMQTATGGNGHDINQ